MLSKIEVNKYDRELQQVISSFTMKFDLPDNYTFAHPFFNESFSNSAEYGAEGSFGPPEIPPEAISFDRDIDVIGNGCFGTVYKAKCRGHRVSVKVPTRQTLSTADLQAFKEEIKIMSKLSHPNIIRFMGACTVLGKLQIVTELCDTDLERALADETYDWGLYDRLKIARDTAKGMAWLHDVANIIHHDLKPANLLIDENNQPKIIDFGLSKFKSARPDTVRGSLQWMAPEKMLRKPFNHKIDVYSFAIILWELITQKKPYQHHHDPVTFTMAVCRNNERPPLTDVPESLQQLLVSCWHNDPDKRLPFVEIVEQLNAIMVSIQIQMQPAADFWRTKFHLQESFEYVPWAIFWQELSSAISVPGSAPYEESFFYCLRKYLTEIEKIGHSTQEIVTMKKFDEVTKWFGAFFMPENGADIIENVNLLSQQPWFHGDISGESANTALAGKGRGSFLIRLSHADPLKAPFTLSRPRNNHLHLERTNEGFLVDGKVYPSLIDFVQQNSAILTHACTNNKENYTTRYTRAL